MSLQLAWDFGAFSGTQKLFDQINGTSGKGNSIVINRNIFRGGTGSLQIINTTSQTGIGILGEKNLSNFVTGIFGFALRIDANPSSWSGDCEILRLFDGATCQVDVRITPSGTMYFTRNGNTLGTPTGLGFSFNAWHFIEVLVTINNTTGVVTLKCDGTQFINLTSQNTRATTNNQFNQFQLGCQNVTFGPYMVYIADFYFCDTSGSNNNTFLGDIGVRSVSPNANGTLNQYTNVTTAWTASTVMGIGRTILDSNNNLQRVTAVTSDLKTGGSAPTWATVAGNTTTDNHVTWTMIGALSQYQLVNQVPIEAVGDWATSTAYALGQMIIDSNGNFQVVTTAGTTGTLWPGPTWNVTVGGTTTDGSVTWTNQGILEDTAIDDSTVSDISRFTFPSISAASVKAALVILYARKTDVSTRSIRAATKSGGTSADNGSDFTLSSTQLYYLGIFETDPNTGSAWGVSALNSAEFGTKTTA